MKTKILTFVLCLCFAARALAEGAGNISSGETAVTTSGNGSVTAIAANTTQNFLVTLTIDNEGPAAGFFSIDGGTTWLRFPANQVIYVPVRQLYNGVLVKRVSGGTDLSALYVWAN